MLNSSISGFNPSQGHQNQESQDNLPFQGNNYSLLLNQTTLQNTQSFGQQEENSGQLGPSLTEEFLTKDNPFQFQPSSTLHTAAQPNFAFKAPQLIFQSTETDKVSATFFKVKYALPEDLFTGERRTGNALAESISFDQKTNVTGRQMGLPNSDSGPNFAPNQNPLLEKPNMDLIVQKIHGDLEEESSDSLTQTIYQDDTEEQSGWEMTFDEIATLAARAEKEEITFAECTMDQQHTAAFAQQDQQQIKLIESEMQQPVATTADFEDIQGPAVKQLKGAEGEAVPIEIPKGQLTDEGTTAKRRTRKAQEKKSKINEEIERDEEKEEEKSQPSALANEESEDEEESETKGSKIKLDEGFKKLLRGSRKAFKQAFHATKLDKGKHHWEEAKWRERVKTFLEDHLKFKNVSSKDISIAVLLLYHSFGPSKDKPVNKKLQIYIDLGDDGMKLFKSIFDNNCKQLVKEFFSHPFILKIWKACIKQNLSFKICFDKEPKEELKVTYKLVSWLFANQFKLPLPEWWVKQFPAYLPPTYKK
ncbi:hypothetical protein FGO68_gene1187 [Halteria grandinella]|uniref:Uncharacterized protein n=1 Tax=Halteria grandinella TaxID=5974 RepID=A0A8J8NRW4_HALGN|nr:hypothetical protein FGO68_gene1187 [Halteria grandinella]